jgi:voltage-gated potassium channel
MTRARDHQGLNGTHPRDRARVALVIYALIVLSSVVIAVETLPSLSERTRRWLVVAEFTILTVFAIEYVLRLTCSPAAGLCLQLLGDHRLHRHRAGGPVPVSRPHDGPVHAAPAAVCAPQAPEGQPRARPDLARDRADPGGASDLPLHRTVMLYLAAVGIYHFEHIAQPEAFGSIPQACGGRWRR